MTKDTDTTDRAPRKEIAVWVSIGSLAVGLVITGLKHASSNGKQEQRVDNIASLQIDSRARIASLEGDRSGNAIMGERVRRIDIDIQTITGDVNDIKQLLQKRVR